MSHPGLPDAEREVKFLREQTLDQEEQIQVKSGCYANCIYQFAVMRLLS